MASNKTAKEGRMRWGKISIPQASGGKRLAWRFLLLACCGASAKLLQLSEPQFIYLARLCAVLIRQHVKPRTWHKVSLQ